MRTENWEHKPIFKAIKYIKTGVHPYEGKKKYFSTGSIQISGLTSEGEFSYNDRPSRANRIVKKGDILQARMKDTNKPVFVDDDLDSCLFSTGFMHFRPLDNSVNPRFVYYYLQSPHFLQLKDDGATGCTQISINDANLSSILFPLPPLGEQEQIVEKLDVILPKIRQLKVRLEKIPILLKRFRQSVLSAAFIGQLTEDWRRSADFVYQRRKIADLVESIKYGTSAKCTREPTGIPILRIPNVQSGYIKPTDLKYAELNDKDKSGLKLSEGDLLLVRSNGSVDLVGRTAIVRSEDTNYGYAGYLMRLRLKKDIVYPGFLNLYFQSYDMRLQIELPARSTTGVHNINSKEVMNLELNLPCFAEQQEIVKIVTKLFGLLDYCEKKCKNALSFIDKIEQSILSNVFNGNY